MRVESTAMEYFLAVCTYGSINKAGKSLQVTPQAVSKAINGLEKKLGYQLLVRTIAGCIPTEKGLEVQKIYLRLQRFQQQAMNEILNLSPNKADFQEVHIGVWGSFASIMPVSDFADFNSLYPSIKLCVHSYKDIYACEAALVKGEVELAFCSGEKNPRYVCIQEYGSAPYLIVSGNNKLASKGRIQLSELRKEKLIADYHRDGKTVYFQEEIDKAGLTPALILPELSDPMKRILVLRENYVAFSYCPTGWLPYGIVPVIISDIRGFENTWFSHASNRPLSDAAQKYADYIVPRFKKDIFENR